MKYMNKKRIGSVKLFTTLLVIACQALCGSAAWGSDKITFYHYDLLISMGLIP